MSTWPRLLVALGIGALGVAAVASLVLLSLSPFFIALAPTDNAKRLPFLALGAFIVSVIGLAFLVRGRSLRTLTGSTATIPGAAFVVALVSVG